MARSWQEDFFERLVTVSQERGDSRLASAKLHPRKKTPSFTHTDSRWIECVLDTNRMTNNPNLQVMAIECATKRGTDIDGPLFERELKKAQVGGDVKIDDGLVLRQCQWGYGRDETFPLHDPRRVNEVINWTHAALRVLFGHLEKHRNVVTAAAPSVDSGATGDFTLALEQYLEDLLVYGRGSLAWTTPLNYLGRQLPCDDLGFIDILARDRATREFVVLELKRDRTHDEVVGQLSRCMGWIKERRATPAGVGVRGIIVVHEVTPKLRAAALAHQNVDLYTYDLAIALQPVALPGRSQTDTVKC
jgi:hypothetical protein